MLRIYFTRHGAGPFVTEDGWLNDKLPEHHNVTSRWHEHFRLGWFDTVAARYALDVIEGVDGLAITHVDYLDTLENWKVCTAYQIGSELVARLPVKHPPDLDFQADVTKQLFAAMPHYYSVPADGFLEFLEGKLTVPVMVKSHSMKAQDKQILKT